VINESKGSVVSGPAADISPETQRAAAPPWPGLGKESTPGSRASRMSPWVPAEAHLQTGAGWGGGLE
jgi:hypothetical protein